MKSNSKTLYALCGIISALTFSAGFISAQQWLGLAAAMVLIVFYFLPKQFYPDWMPIVQLVGLLLLSAGASFLPVPPFFFFAGLIFALAGLEMRSQGVFTSGFSNLQGQNAYSRTHLVWLAGVCLTSLLLCGISLTMEFKIPFILMILLVAGIAYLNYRLISLLIDHSNKKRISEKDQ